MITQPRTPDEHHHVVFADLNQYFEGRSVKTEIIESVDVAVCVPSASTALSNLFEYVTAPNPDKSLLTGFQESVQATLNTYFAMVSERAGMELKEITCYKSTVNLLPPLFCCELTQYVIPNSGYYLHIAIAAFRPTEGDTKPYMAVCPTVFARGLTEELDTRMKSLSEKYLKEIDILAPLSVIAQEIVDKIITHRPS